MKSHLIIENVGPLRHVDIYLNKINVVIGPQSSGKSTIAKIVSFCQWLEKSVVANQGKEHIDSEFLRVQLIAYHGFENYFSEQSFIRYESGMIDFDFHSIEKFSLEVKNLQDAVMTKVAYIPAERVYANIPNISTLSLESKYTRQFIFDWLGLRSKYNLGNSLKILDFDVEFYYDENFGDAIKLGNGKPIHLYEASSGLQSLTPMLVYVDYVTNWIYRNASDKSYEKEKDISTSKYKVLLSQIYKEKSKKKAINTELDTFVQSGLKDDDTRQLLDVFLTSLKLIGKYGKDSEFSPILEKFNQITKYHSTKLTIEEGEMNVFPSTQYSLVKHLIASMDFDRGDTLFLTTHSPYIMTSLNNLIQASNAAKERVSDSDEIERAIPRECWINYDSISAWSVADGTVEPINDDEVRLISADALDKASELISNDFSKLI